MYILSSKLYCGHCFTPMTGTSGTGRNGKLHSYYKEKGKGCKNLTVTKHRIEDKVIEVVREMLSEGNMQLIACEISSLCNIEMENPNFKRLQRLINENNKQKANLLKSLKIGKASPNAASYVFNEIDKMDKELAELEKLKAVEEDRNYGLTEIDIMYFLHHLKKGDIDDPDYRKLLVNVLANSVYLYEDDNRAFLTFHSSSIYRDMSPSVYIFFCNINH